VRRFETDLLVFVESSHPGLLADIADKKTLTDEIKAGLKQVLEDFKLEWNKKSKDDLPVPPRPTSSPAAQPTA
jgi:F0F1-type ATP synthase alpha subunit